MRAGKSKTVGLDSGKPNSNHHDIYELLRHDDDLLDCLAIGEWLHFSGVFRGGFKIRLRCVQGHLDYDTQFAIHLHRDFQHVRDKQSRIELRPRRVGE